MNAAFGVALVYQDVDGVFVNFAVLAWSPVMGAMTLMGMVSKSTSLSPWLAVLAELCEDGGAEDDGSPEGVSAGAWLHAANAVRTNNIHKNRDNTFLADFITISSLFIKMLF